MRAAEQICIIGAPLGRAGKAYNPVTALGADLLAYWDANRPDLIAQSAGSVSSWTDIVAGYIASQATGSSQPVYASNSFNGAPSISFDGIDDCLTVAAHSLPINATPSEIWVLLQQDAPASDVVVRRSAAYGGSSTNNQRASARNVVSTVNRFLVQCGTGAASLTSTEGTVDFSTRHAVREIISATQITPEIDGVTGSVVACVPSTSAGMLRIGATASAAAANFHQGKIAALLVTNALSTAEANGLRTYLMNRRML